MITFLRTAFLIVFIPGFISFQTIAQTFEWAKSAGGERPDFSTAIAVDASGNVYTAGYYNSESFQIGDSIFTRQGEEDLFIAKYDPSGKFLWAKHAGGIGIDMATSVAVDPKGDVYLTGFFNSDKLIFDNIEIINSAAQNSDMFLVKFNPDGNVLWAKREGSSQFEQATCLAFDKKGNLFVTGRWNSDEVKFGSTTLYTQGSNDLFLVKYDKEGNILWAVSAGGMEWDEARSVSCDSEGNIYLTGYYGSEVMNFDTVKISKQNKSYDIFITKYDTNGNILWAKTAGGAENDIGNSIAVDKSGNSFITGSFASTSLKFGDSTLMSPGFNDSLKTDNIFIVKYDASGNYKWGIAAGDSIEDEGLSICVDDSGNAYAAGYFTNPLYQPEMFVSKYNTNGKNLWTLNCNNTLSVKGTSITSDPYGNAYISGYFENNQKFGSITLNSKGVYDIFIAKINPYITSVNPEFTNNEVNYQLENNYPNPFNPSTTIKYSIPTESNIRFVIYNLIGEVVMEINETKPAGNYQVNFNSSALPSGVYIYSLDANPINGQSKYQSSKKMILLK